MLNLAFEQDRALIEQEFAIHEWLEDTGLAPDVLREKCSQLWNGMEGRSIQARRAAVTEYILDHAQIEVRPYEVFADLTCGEGIINDLTWPVGKAQYQTIGDQLSATNDAKAVRAFTGEQDFGHTCPGWDSILNLGLPGIIDRLETAKENAPAENLEFYDCAISAYRALVRLAVRLAEKARSMSAETPRLSVVADNLEALTKGAPRTLHQALQLSTLYYHAQHDLERCYLRSMGRFDMLYRPFYERDVEEGRLTCEEAKELIKYYFCRWNARKVTANIPLTLCGTDEKGEEVGSDFTIMLLEAYGELNIISPKFHIRVSDGMREDILRKVMSLIREGSSAFVFCSDKQVVESLMRLGQSYEDANDYVMVGCYESTSMGREVACSCNGCISFPKAVEYAMTGGIDLMTGQQIGLPREREIVTFDDLLCEVDRQLIFFADQCMDRISLIERQYPVIFSSAFFSGCMSECVQAGRDIYTGSAKYNNSSINSFGIATAADSLSAIRQLVYEEKRLTLDEFTEILRNNWEGHEKLRILAEKKTTPYGVNNPAADELAVRLMSCAANRINGHSNGRGGVFRMGAFSIDWRIAFGRQTAASANGRRAGEPLSKNLCACLGRDTEGVTAMLHSAARFDAAQLPNGAVLDLILHESAVRGEEGLNAMLGVLTAFVQAGGMCLQFNVLSADTLRRAQAEPEKYPTLQVRLCGWNVLFIDLSRRDQDELIARTEIA